ncbi:MAG: AAA family ATPase, partial [Planctomycetia bacterium]|nr:AAA family ATPase [Planctomycetia bacterium]
GPPGPQDTIIFGGLMRIDRLDLLAFGPFTGAVLDLSGGSEGLHLVYGPNEAGKSSAMRAIHHLFCGIPPQSTDNFVHKYADLRIGARLRDHAGSALEVVRRKGTKNTLLGSGGGPIDDPDARLARVLGGVSPEEFLKKFVIDHAELVGGGKTVVEGGGDLGRVLFAAGAGLAGLGAVQKSLDDEADALFKRGGSKPLINLKLAELEATRKKIKDDTLRSSEWRDHDEAHRAALARKDALERDLDAATRERAHLRNLSEALEPIARRSALLGELRTLVDAPRLSADFTYRRRDAESRIGPNEKFEADALRKVADLTESFDALDVPAPLLEQADAIAALHLRLGSHQKDKADRDRLDADRARFEAEARTILLDLGRDPGSADGLETLRLKAPDRAAVHDLANERQALSQARDDAAKALQTLDAKVQTVAAKLAALGLVRDTAPLRKAVKRAQAQGDLDALLRPEREALARDKRRAGVAPRPRPSTASRPRSARPPPSATPWPARSTSARPR